MSSCSCQNPLILTGVIQKVNEKSIMCISTIITPAFTNPILRRIHKSQNSLLRNSGPLFPQKPSKVLRCAADTALPRTSQACSMHDKSGETAGHSILFTLFLCMKSSQYALDAVWHCHLGILGQGLASDAGMVAHGALELH